LNIFLPNLPYVKNLYLNYTVFFVLTTPDLKQTAKPVKPKINWARIEEADNFAKTVKLFRQGKYDED